MAIDFTKLEALSMFGTGNADAIANKGVDGIVQKGTYHGPLGSIFRSKATQSANNEMRAELLDSLGKAFNIAGSRNDNGKLSFSDKFMDRLEWLIGKGVFKRDDFGIDENGVVTSGKPLTERRIKAILSRVQVLAQAPEAEEATINPKLLAAYNQKKASVLDDIKLGFIEGDNVERVQDFLAHVDHEIAAFDKLEGAFENVHSEAESNLIFQNPERVGFVHHPGKGLEGYQVKTPAMYQSYAKHVLSEYVNYLMEQFVSEDNVVKRTFLPDDTCIEAKTSTLQLKKVNRDIGVMTKHDQNTKLSDCIFDEIDVYQKTNLGKEATWAQVESTLKAHLVGKVRPVDTYQNGQRVEATGKARKVKAVDIDNLKPYILDMLVMAEGVY